MAKDLTFEDEVAILYGTLKADPDNESVKADYESARDLILRFKAKDGMTLESFETSLGERLEAATKKAEAAKKASVNKVINEAKASTIAKVEAVTSLAEARALLSEVEGFGERYSITLTATGFSTNLKRASTAGKGRPGKNDHSGFAVVASGKAIIGGFNTWVKEQIEAKAFDSETMAKLHGSQSGKLKAKAETSKVLLAANLVVEVEIPSEDTKAEASEETLAIS